MTDPILRHIADESPDEFAACVRAIVALGSDTASGIASLEFLPEEVVCELARHDSSEVREKLARNLLCPSDVLAQLAMDTDEGVRISAVRNPGSTEEARAAFALLSSPEELALASDSGTGTSREEDAAVAPDELRKIAEEELSKDLPMMRDQRMLESLFSNPALPHDVRERLIEAGAGSGEWGLEPLMWPSTRAFLSDSAPEELIAVLARMGHPAALLHVGVAAAPPSVDPVLGLRDLINSGLLVRALWRELAISDAVRLDYVRGYDGDRFFPVAAGLDLMGEYSLACEIIGGGWDPGREWVDLTDFLDNDRMIGLAAGEFEDFLYVLSDSLGEEFDDAQLERFALCGVAWMSEMDYVPIRWTLAGQEVFDEALRVVAELRAEGPDYDTKVSIVASRLPTIGYAGTSGQQKSWLTDLIRQSRQDSMVSAWGLADHFLMCIGLHPATPHSIREQLLADESDNVRQAARLGSDKSIPR